MLSIVARQCPHCGQKHAKSTKRCPSTGLPIAGDPKLVGQLFAGRYQLVRLLGDGGMGAVYKAADQVLRRFVAIKLLHPAVAQKASSVERFQREARAAAAIGHPNIIDIMDFGREQNRPFMVMEYLRGRSLSQVITVDGAMSIKRASTIAIHTLAGLQAAHDRGILHRDLKPANLMLVARFGDRTFVKVCDFGFAALLDSGRTDAKALTPERTLVGTPAYAAPERLRGDDRRDPRLDIYSVGVLLYEMLAGRRPFDAPTFRELARKVRKEPPPSIVQIRRDIPPELEAVVMRALAKDKELRWPNAHAMAEALQPFAQIRGFMEEMPAESFTMEMVKIKAREKANIREKADIRPSVPAPPQLAPIPALRPSSDEAQRSPSRQRLTTKRSGSRKTQRERRPDRVIERARELDPQKQSAPQAALHKTAPDMKATNTLRQPPQFNGRIVFAILRFVARRFGERALKDLLRSLPDQTRALFDSGVREDHWIDFRAVALLVETIDAKLGQDDMLLMFETGRASAEGAFELMRALRPPAPPAELLVAETPALLQKIAHGIEICVRRVGRGYGRLEVIENHEPSLTLAVSTLGFMEHSLEHFGAQDVEVNLLSSRALGDQHTLIDLSWFV